MSGADEIAADKALASQWPKDAHKRRSYIMLCDSGRPKYMYAEDGDAARAFVTSLVSLLSPGKAPKGPKSFNSMLEQISPTNDDQAHNPDDALSTEALIMAMATGLRTTAPKPVPNAARKRQEAEQAPALAKGYNLGPTMYDRGPAIPTTVDLASQEDDEAV